MVCEICNAPFTKQNEIIYLCNHKKGFIHMGCCTDMCSWNHMPCEHKEASFMNLEIKK